MLQRLFFAGVVAFAAFALTNPFALLDNSCEVITPAFDAPGMQIPAIDWRSCYLDNVARQSRMVRGGTAFPFVRQYAGTTPYLYYVEMQLRWGMGLLLGLISLAGFGWITARTGRQLLGHLKMMPARLRSAGTARPASRAVYRAHLILLAWCLPYFLSTGSFFVKFMRYMQPLTPLLMLFGALLVWRIRRPAVCWIVAGVVLAFTAAYAVGFTNLYAQPHPWNTASRWIFDHVRPDSTILVEQWDQPLPSSLTVDGETRSRKQYRTRELTWLTGMGPLDDEEKLLDNLEKLAAADYVVIASNRIYGVVPRLPVRYPLSHQYHPLLFDGRLGYRPVLIADRTPELLGLHFFPDRFGWPGLEPPPAVTAYFAQRPGRAFGRADESFTVYDQPLTIIFANEGHLSVEEMAALFETARFTGE